MNGLEFEEFLRWRFTEPSYGTMSKIEMKSLLHQVSPEDSRELWSLYVGLENQQPVDVGVSSVRPGKVIFSGMIDHDSADAGQATLSASVEMEGFADAYEIIAFWGPSLSVKSSWKTFLSHWRSFWLSDDEEVMVCPEKKVRFIHINGQLYVEKMDL